MKAPLCPVHKVRLVCRTCELGKIARAGNAAMTPEARTHRARKAALARWARVRTVDKAVRKSRGSD